MASFSFRVYLLVSFFCLSLGLSSFADVSDLEKNERLLDMLRCDTCEASFEEWSELRLYLEANPNDDETHRLAVTWAIRNRRIEDYVREFGNHADLMNMIFQDDNSRNLNEVSLFSAFWTHLVVCEPCIENLNALLKTDEDIPEYIPTSFISNLFEAARLHKENDLIKGFFRTITRRNIDALSKWEELYPDDSSLRQEYLEKLLSTEEDWMFLSSVADYVQRFPIDPRINARLDDIREKILNRQMGDFSTIYYLKICKEDLAVKTLALSSYKEFCDFRLTEYLSLYPDEKDKILQEIRNEILNKNDFSKAFWYLNQNRDDREIRDLVRSSISKHPRKAEDYVRWFPEERDAILSEIRTQMEASNDVDYVSQAISKFPYQFGKSSREKLARLVLGSGDEKVLLTYLMSNENTLFREEIHEKLEPILAKNGNIWTIEEYVDKFPDRSSFVRKLKNRLLKKKDPSTLGRALRYKVFANDDELKNVARKLILRQTGGDDLKGLISAYVEKFPEDEEIKQLEERQVEKRKGKPRGRSLNKQSILSFIGISSLLTESQRHYFEKFFNALLFLNTVVDTDVDFSPCFNYEKVQESFDDFFPYFMHCVKSKFAARNPFLTIDFSPVRISELVGIKWVESAILKVIDKNDLEFFEEMLLWLIYGHEDLLKEIPLERIPLIQRVLQKFYDEKALSLSENDREELETYRMFQPAKPVRSADNMSLGIHLQNLLVLALLALGSKNENLYASAIQADPEVAFSILKERKGEKELSGLLERSLGELNPNSSGYAILQFYLLLEKNREEKEASGLFGRVRQWFGGASTEDDILNALGEAHKWGDGVEDSFLDLLNSRVMQFKKSFLSELRNYLNDLPYDHSLTFSQNFNKVIELATQMSLESSPDRVKRVRDGLDVWEYDNPSILAFKVDPAELELRVVHVDSWVKGKTLEQFLKDEMAVGGMNGGFWTYEDTSFKSWALRRFAGNFFSGERSTIPSSILQTPRGLANDSRDYWAAIGWKYRPDRTLEVHGSYLKTKWFLSFGGKRFQLQRVFMRPYAEKSYVSVKTSSETRLLVVEKGAINELKEMDEKAGGASPKDEKTSNMFSLDIDSFPFDEAVRSSQVAIDYTFFIPKEGRHTEDDDSQDAIWKSMNYIMTGQPFLVQDGKANKDVAFSDSQLRRISGALGFSIDRSALCFLKSGQWLMVTFKSASPEILAVSLEKLGCLHAINLDGGPSAGLQLRSGEYRLGTQRKVSDVLLIYEKNYSIKDN